MKKAFTFVELLIVVAVIGIFAAIVLPTLQGHIKRAKESAAKDDLRILRSTIEIYAAQHKGVPPGYLGNNPIQLPTNIAFWDQISGTGNYLPEIPTNPFNGKVVVKMIGNSETFPTQPISTNLYGWIYKPATKTIKLNWPGIDSAGVAYFDY
ncbi:MAG: prepilin-type N-terminal cleavage/methylation domain-containing protein [Sedimentisphaerales bacterium]|nr:prepilin-type N-terminal cleavage/methylation domain-containing protein [Sedimentisphaerales bacterium]